MAKNSQHVIPNERGWSVKRSDASRASSVHPTQVEAIEAAKRIAKKNGAEVYIHDRDGRIRQRNSYPSDR